MDYQLVSSREWPTTFSYEIYTSRNYTGWSQSLGDSPNYYGKYPKSPFHWNDYYYERTTKYGLQDDWMVWAMRSINAHTASNGAYATIGARCNISFAPQTITKIRYAWTVYASGDSARVHRRDYMRVHFSDGTYTNLHGTASRHSGTPIISQAVGEWHNVVGITVQLYGSGRAKNTTYSYEHSTIHVRFGQIVAYNSIDVSPIVYSSSSTVDRRLCTASSVKDALPFRMYDGTDIKAVALLDDDAPDPINAEGVGKSGYKIMTNDGVKDIAAI